MNAFKNAVKDGSIIFHGSLKEYSNQSLWVLFVDDLYAKQWIVYSKPPFASPEQVLKYLGGYTHRIAISNHRIIDVSDTNVSFKLKSYADENKTKIMRLTIVEFIRRFLLHILPKRYQRIRYYGFLSNRKRKESLVLCFKILGKIRKIKAPVKTTLEVLELCKRIFGQDLTLCPDCKIGNLQPAFTMGRFAGDVF